MHILSSQMILVENIQILRASEMCQSDYTEAPSNPAVDSSNFTAATSLIRAVLS